MNYRVTAREIGTNFPFEQVVTRKAAMDLANSLRGDGYHDVEIEEVYESLNEMYLDCATIEAQHSAKTTAIISQYQDQWLSTRRAIRQITGRYFPQPHDLRVNGGCLSLENLEQIEYALESST